MQKNIKSLFLASVVLNLIATNAFAGFNCQTPCSEYVESTLARIESPSPTQYAAFHETCPSLGGKTFGASFSCGPASALYCVSPTTLTAVGFGVSDSEFEARTQSKNNCLSQLPTDNTSCSQYYWVGTKQLGSTSCTSN